MNQAYAYLGESTLDAYNSQGQYHIPKVADGNG